MGSGAFGRVFKADVVSLKKEEPVTTVAFKMVRYSPLVTGSNGATEAFISELKILLFPRGELYVIVEYCRFGSLCTFLRQQRRIS